MAPALTEPVSHRQSKISSPAQASSPRPIISDVIDQPQTTTTTAAINSHHRLALQTNGGGVPVIADNFASTKEVQNLQVDNQLEEVVLPQLPPPPPPPQKINQPKADHLQESDFQSIFVQHQHTSNGPSIGPSFVTHMDQQNNDQSIVTDQFNQHSNAGHELLNAIVDGSQAHLRDKVAQLLDSTPTQDLQQLQQELLQQQSQDELLQQHAQEQNQQLDQQFSFALQQTQYTAGQSMDLLMSADQSHQATAMPSRSDNGQATGSCQNAIQSDMDQMLDIDIIKVLESFETTPAVDNLGDLDGTLSLFTDMDVMNIGLEDVVSTSMSRESRTQEMLTEIEKKREKMIRECDFMMRRLRKVQARHMGRHISEEVGGVYEYTQQLIKRKERETKSISTMTPINQLHSDKNKLNSSSAWKMLLKRIEHAAANQHSNTSSSKLLAAEQHANNFQAFVATTQAATGASAAAAAAKPSVIQCVPPFDASGIQQLKQCSGLLNAELKLVGKSFDSDATESSSGGESADEGVSYNNPTQESKSIAKRAAYRWARDRAKIASRWTWLLAQISDLEYRIRQHQELYVLLKKSNGQVTFEDGGEPVASTSTENVQSTSVNGYRGNLPGSGRLGDMDDATAKLYGDDDVELNGSARTRAFKASAFKKRKLLQSTNLHKISRRAARPCTIKCGCRWPVHPCLLCTGRTDPTAPRDLPDMMSTQESVALLDPCYHPILSFPEDVAQNIYMEATLRQPEWQTRVARTSTKAIKGALALQKASERDENRSGLAATGVTSRKNADPTHSAIKKMSAKKFKLIGNKLKKSQNNTTNNNRKMKKSAHSLATKMKKNKSRKNSHMSATSSDHHDMDVGSPNGSVSRSKNPSPIPGYSYRLHSERRHNKNAYDIDNIVIPSTVSSRVEILSYKEIPTPKWRVIEGDDEIITTPSHTEPVEEPKPAEPVEVPPTTTQEEDISNEAYAQRHERALLEERKKFITFLKFPYSTRSRANRRIDSQSSGANTPDPMSPAPSTPAAATNIDQESAPPTPQPADAPGETTQEPGKNNNNNSTNANNNGAVNPVNPVNPVPVTIPKQERRRTVSFRKGIDAREELLRRSTTPDVKELISPYEPLIFPIPGDTLEQMIQCMPTSYKDIINSCIDQVTGDKTQSATSSDVAANPASLPPPTTTLASNCKSRLTTQQYSDLSMLVEDSDETESIQEDANDPEWNFEPPQRIQKTQ